MKYSYPGEEWMIETLKHHIEIEEISWPQDWRITLLWNEIQRIRNEIKKPKQLTLWEKH